MALGLGALLNFGATGVAILAAAALLALNFNDRAVRAFATLLVFRGLAGAAYGLGVVAADPDWSLFWWNVTPYFVIPVTFAAITFAAVYPSSGATRLRASVVPVAFALALVAEFAYLANHALFWDLQGAIPASGPQGDVPVGPLFLFYAAFEFAFAVVAARCIRAYLRTPEGPRRRSVFLVALGFSLVVVYDGIGLLALAPEFVLDRPPLLGAGLAALLVGAVLLVAGSWAVALRRAGSETAVRRAVLALLAAAASVALVAALPRGPTASAVAQGVGLVWRLALPILVAYALVRYRIFDIELRIRWTIEKGTLAGVFFVTFLVVAEIAQNFFSDTYGWLFGGTVAALMLFGLRPIETVAHRLAERAMPGVRDSPDYHAGRRLSVYRAACEEAWSDRAMTTKERAILDRLRDELGLDHASASEVESEVARRASQA